jgi:diguanylate cyclase (GGDEF)-like protein
VSLLLAAQLLAMVALIVRRGWRLEPSLRAVAVTLALGMASLLLRAVDAALHPADYQGFFQASLGNGLTYLASYLFPLGAGFVLANLERSTLRLQQQAMHDSLTGCVNRGTFDLLLAHACERARREGAALSMLMLDLDEFKAVNDRHGHPGGDEVLRAFAAAVRARLRGSDVFGRLGGEEFALVLPATEAVGAMRLAEDLRAAVERLAITLASGATVQVTVSLGVATAAPGAGAQPEALHARADEALYAAKHAGRNRVRAHEPAPSGADPLAGAAAAGAR